MHLLYIREFAKNFALNSQFAYRVVEFVSTCISCSDKSVISGMKY